MQSINLVIPPRSGHGRTVLMKLLKPSRPPLSLRARCQEWKANLALRHCWFRVLLHVCAMVRCPRNIRWHWRHIAHEFSYARQPRQ